MEFKGTKGKWELSENGGVYVTSNIGMICDLVTSSKEDKANALLISKAPEMLTALQEVIRLRDLIDYDESIVNESNIGEASALRQILNRIETLIKEATEL